MRQYAQLKSNDQRRTRQASENTSAWVQPQAIISPAAGCVCEGDCPVCAPVQAKIRIGAPRDKYELEADRVAEQVMHMPDNSASHNMSKYPPTLTPLIQRESLEYQEDEQDEDVVMQTKGLEKTVETPRVSNSFQPLCQGGQPLPPETRNYFEPRFDRDFSQVRVHTDAEAGRSAAEVDAKAYTSGNHIVFGRGQGEYETESGRHLLAHELSHVVQQNGGQASEQGSNVDLTKKTSPGVQCDGEADSGLEDLLVDLLLSSLPGALATEVLDQSTSPESREVIYNFFGVESTSELLQQQGSKYLEKILDEQIPERIQQALNDVITSVMIAPDFFTEIFWDEIIAAIEENWEMIITILWAFLTVEVIIAVLLVIPEPITELIAAILQAVILMFLIEFFAIEAYGFFDEGFNWLTLAVEANGDQQQIEAASRAFLRMLRHMIIAILLAAGIRVRIKSMGALTKGMATEGAVAEGAITEGAAAEGIVGEGASNVTRLPIRTAPPSSVAPTQGVAPSSAFEGPLARQLVPAPAEPFPVPIIEPPPPNVIPFPGTAPVTAPATLPGVVVPVTATDVAASGAAGISAVTHVTPGVNPASDPQPKKKKGQDECGQLPILWPVELPLPPTPNMYRTKSKECDEYGTCRKGSLQRALQKKIREAIALGTSLPCVFTAHPHCCSELYTSGNTEEIEPEIFLQPPYGYEEMTPECYPEEYGVCEEAPGEDWLEPAMSVPHAAHHIHPLFLGGADAVCNLCTMETEEHTLGHQKLKNQPEYLSYYEQCGINTYKLYSHPSDTEYVIVGFK